MTEEVARRLAGGEPSTDLYKSVRRACLQLAKAGKAETTQWWQERVEHLAAKPSRPVTVAMWDPNKGRRVQAEVSGWYFNARPASERKVSRLVASVRRPPSAEVVAKEAAEAAEREMRFQRLMEKWAAGDRQS